MGLYQDQTNSLSEIKRLAILVMDPSRRQEIGADQWPLAMIAYGLVTCNDPARLPEGIEIYGIFSSWCAVDARGKCLAHLADFVHQSKGNGWRAFLPFALADENGQIRQQAAFLAGTMAIPAENAPFVGFSQIAGIICSPPYPGQRQNSPLLDAILNTADLRLAPIASHIREHLPAAKLEQLVADSRLIPNALSCEWLLAAMEQAPALTPCIVETLANCATRADEIQDVVLPIPSWNFKNAAIQPLHGWSKPEYFDRMKSRIAPLVNEEQMERIESAWQS